MIPVILKAYYYFTLVDYTSYCKFYVTLIQIHKLTLIQLYMYIYMKAQFQIFPHKLIKYTDSWGTAFSLGYLIKNR